MKHFAILIFILLPVLAFGGTMTETRNLALAADGIDTLVVKMRGRVIEIEWRFQWLKNSDLRPD